MTSELMAQVLERRGGDLHVLREVRLRPDARGLGLFRAPLNGGGGKYGHVACAFLVRTYDTRGVARHFQAASNVFFSKAHLQPFLQTAVGC